MTWMPERGPFDGQQCGCMKHPQYVGRKKIQTTYVVEEPVFDGNYEVERCIRCKGVVGYVDCNIIVD